ncbi:HdaA/DnaA family protein [Pseudoroseicyclus sp. CXY001]|uniref:DnaA/Hda family protein n=1 Tax=Pseudoroseicyclus sp. CXY001 TaxID=3242492 RepID=UPI003570CB26
MSDGQLSFHLPGLVSQGAENFFLSDGNAALWEMVTDPARWPAGKLALVGPAASGKSHLARVLEQTEAAQVVPAARFALPVLPPPGRLVVVEDMEALPEAAEEPLFHLHNHLAATGGRLMMTARTPPRDWPLRLNDLATRVQAALVMRIPEPDDALLFGLLLKHFADRQLRPAPDVIPWLAGRLERSHAAVAEAVAALDDAGLREGRNLTVPFARDVLGE